LQAGIALRHSVLHLDCAAYRVHNTAEVDENAVAGALYDAAVMGRDRRIDQIAPQRPEPRQRPLLVGAGHARVARDIRRQDRR